MDLAVYIKQKISEAVSKEFNISDANFTLEHPDNEDFGDFATNVALILSRMIKQSPIDVANKVSYRLQNLQGSDLETTTNENVFKSVSVVAPGFINFKIADKWITKLLTQNLTEKNNYGVRKIDDVKRIALEHSNVNPNKAAHVGHLRNACIGQFIERSYEMQGFDVEVQYYANNAGVQVATSMMGVENVSHLSPTTYLKFDHYAWDVYSEMESRITASEDLQKKRLDILKQLENPLSEVSIKQRKLADKILIEQLKTFSQLGFDYDVIIYESDILAKKLWEIAFDKLKLNPNVYLAEEGPSQGCWLVRLGNDSRSNNQKASTVDSETVETDKIIVRSNGVATYTGKDIAYHMWKYGLIDIDFDYCIWKTGTQTKPLYVTSKPLEADIGEDNDVVAAGEISFSGVTKVYDVIGTEQTYAIDVVKQSLDFLGFHEQSLNMRHINYGFVFLSKDTAAKLGIDTSDGRKFYAMSGRKGWGIKVDDLIDMVDTKLKENFGSFDEIAKVRNGAIKFSMLKSNTFQDLIFDLDEALDIKGYSGPYLQYAYVRANSILRKALSMGININFEDISGLEKLFEGDLSYILDNKEEKLVKFLIRFPEVVIKSSSEFSPNLLCDYLFELAKRFSTFYNDVSILNADNNDAKVFRLHICHYFSEVMKKGLWLLGIDAPNKM